MGIIFVSGRFREKAHCVFGASGRTLMIDLYIDSRKTRFVNIYAPVTRSNTNNFYKDLHPCLLEPIPHVILGDFNCIIDSNRDVRGPGQGRSTYHPRKLEKILKHLLLSDAWVFLHKDLVGPTRIGSRTASRIDRVYLPDLLYLRYCHARLCLYLTS